MLRRVGLQDVEIRAAVLALPAAHPYRRLPVQFATSLHQHILDAGILRPTALEAAMVECEQAAADPDTTIVSFVVTQVWGHKPEH